MVNRLKLEEMDKVLNYALQHIEQHNFDGAVVVLHASIKQLVATLRGADLDNEKDPHVNIYTKKECTVSIHNILEISADVFNVTIDEIRGRKRTMDVVLARQTAVYFCRKLDYTVQELGAVFNRNHSNISHTCKKVDDYIQCDREIGAKINQVGDRINAMQQ